MKELHVSRMDKLKSLHDIIFLVAVCGFEKPTRVTNEVRIVFETLHTYVQFVITCGVTEHKTTRRGELESQSLHMALTQRGRGVLYMGESNYIFFFTYSLTSLTPCLFYRLIFNAPTTAKNLRYPPPNAKVSLLRTF